MTTPVTFDPPIARYKWFRRLVLGTIGVVGLLLGWRLLLGYRVGVELAGYEQRVRDAGGLWRAGDDIEKSSLPDDQNAALIYRELVDMLESAPTLIRFHHYRPDAVRPEVWDSTAQKTDENGSAIFNRAADAMRRHRAHWRRWASARTSWHLEGPGEPELWMVGQVLANNAEFRHRRGDDKTTWLRLKSLNHLARSLQADPSVANLQTAASLHRTSASVVVLVGATLRVEAIGGVDALAEMIDELDRDEKSLEQAGRVATLSNIMQERSFANHVRGGSWLHRPIFDRWIAVRASDALVVNAEWGKGGPDSEFFVFSPADDNDQPMLRIPHGTEGLALMPPGRWELGIQNRDQLRNGRAEAALNMAARVEMRFARVVLAVRWFHHVHGRYPQQMAELIPQYLSAVPTYPGQDSRRIEFVTLPGEGAGENTRRLLSIDPKAPALSPPIDAPRGFMWHANGGQPDQRLWRDIGALPTSDAPSLNP